MRRDFCIFQFIDTRRLDSIDRNIIALGTLRHGHLRLIGIVLILCRGAAGIITVIGNVVVGNVILPSTPEEPKQ